MRRNQNIREILGRVGRLPEQHGVLVHRSFWVPYAQISELLTMIAEQFATANGQVYQSRDHVMHP